MGSITMEQGFALSRADVEAGHLLTASPTPHTDAPVRWRHLDQDSFELGRERRAWNDDHAIGIRSAERIIIDASGSGTSRGQSSRTMCPSADPWVPGRAHPQGPDVRYPVHRDWMTTENFLMIIDNVCMALHSYASGSSESRHSDSRY